MEGQYSNNPKYFSDGLKLQVIFPEDVWLLIFKNIKDFNHYHKIDAASPYFHTLLLSLRTRILFPEVIRLCTKSIHLARESDYYLSFLHCRAACKVWKEGVDATLNQIWNETNTDGRDWKCFGCPTYFLNWNQTRTSFEPDIYNESKLDNLLEVFHNSHLLASSNPFPSRSIVINILAGGTIYSKLFDILKTYGHHIWHCYVRLWFDNQEKMQQGALIFLKLLALLPHLQTLRIKNASVTDWNTEYLEHILTANPMPKFKNLQLLVVHRVARPIFSQLIQNNPHIKKVRISELEFSIHSTLFTTPLPNLEELDILGFQSAEDFSQLQSVQVQWPLEKLNILCHQTVLHVNNMLSWIDERWAQSLTELNLIIPLSVSVSETESSLKLPSLKNLRLQMERYTCLDFILHLSKSLVSLSVYHAGMDKYDDSLEKDCKIEFFSHKENLGKSNIWKFFPRLRYLNYADDSVRKLRDGRAYRRNHWVGYNIEGL